LRSLLKEVRMSKRARSSKEKSRPEWVAANAVFDACYVDTRPVFEATYIDTNLLAQISVSVKPQEDGDGGSSS